MKTAEEWARIHSDMIYEEYAKEASINPLIAKSRAFPRFIEAIRQEQREACAEAVKKLNVSPVYGGIEIKIDAVELFEAIRSAGKEE